MLFPSSFSANVIATGIPPVQGREVTLMLSIIAAGEFPDISSLYQ